ncbi:MAG: hypothetical protein GY859_19690 [Desulfobacterales bacterium]|nr:hypothetical protein [Desulfobacterales bacterium]
MFVHPSIWSGATRCLILLTGVVVLLMGADALAADTTCTPSNLAIYDTRVHVKCVESVGGIQWFATSTADSAKAARVLSVINTAMVTGRALFIYYDPEDVSGASFGCQASDCRIITGIGFWQ